MEVKLKFDLILTNPPFQDTVNRNSTPHKLWIDFTKAVFDRLLADGGVLCQVSPASFGSPSNVVLDLMRENQTLVLRYDTEHHFQATNLKPGSTFSDYAVCKAPTGNALTSVVTSLESFPLRLDEKVWYLPNDLSPVSIGIHSKVIWGYEGERLPVEWDYVTCHNINRYAQRSKHKKVTLSENPGEEFPFPAYHTTGKCWWSSIQPEYLTAPKVIWSRSGYMKPIADPGKYAVTDMAYFVRVKDVSEAENLAHNLSRSLIKYISLSAKWSGFGNERVFAALPSLPRNLKLSDREIYEMFSLSEEEVNYVEAFLAPKRRGRAPKA